MNNLYSRNVAHLLIRCSEKEESWVDQKGAATMTLCEVYTLTHQLIVEQNVSTTNCSACKEIVTISAQNVTTI